MADPGSDVSEPDLVLEAEDDDQLDPTYTPEEIERIQNDATNADNAANIVTQDPPAANKKKRKFVKDLKAEVWKYFTKGVEQDDGSYTAVCNYCGEIYKMGNSRGTGSLRHHYKSGCKKMPRNSHDKLQKMLHMTNVADKRAFSLVLDNASSNDACIRELLCGPISDNLPVDGQVFHQRCGCHILNLVVDAGLSVVGDQISKIRETMKFLRHSQARMERFQLASSQAKVPFKKPAWDVATRWNSTFLMLELALYLRPVIDRYSTLDKNYTKSMQLNNNDWLGMEALMDCLKVFYNVTLKFSGTKYPTLNVFFPEFCDVFVNIKSMEKSPYSFITMMASKMLPKWERYWTSANTLLAIACVLDPRCKLTAVEYYYKLIYPQDHEWYINNLKGCINALFDEYFKAYSLQQSQGESSQAQSQSQSQASGPSSSGTGSSTVNDIRAGLKSLLAEKNTAEPLKSELEQYLTEPLDATALDASFDILAWWKLKVTVYPVMARLARDVLAVPASTVASESTFSTSGRTLSTVRNSLNDESLQALICAQDWLRCGEVGATATLWASAEATLDDTICGSHQA
ncbi:hypothetical protein LUZ63_004883 [Rhynchospora breviuscula]|uniref:BED-type domain-containing protein n=1 Tax=Rhynchospora breviuscula TaxID=2022672 RepID=A0A9Q0HRZ6_9POAL|nr:hypothetical protein LUZ63_004883 [Rhynchospora breviuscula]